MLWTSSQTTLAKYPRFVAEFLNRDPTCFTGNCWRRRELLETDRATILAENGKNKNFRLLPDWLCFKISYIFLKNEKWVRASIDMFSTHIFNNSHSRLLFIHLLCSTQTFSYNKRYNKVITHCIFLEGGRKWSFFWARIEMPFFWASSPHNTSSENYSSGPERKNDFFQKKNSFKNSFKLW